MYSLLTKTLSKSKINGLEKALILIKVYNEKTT